MIAALQAALTPGRLERSRAEYPHRQPFPHAVFDGVAPQSLLKRLDAEFPDDVVQGGESPSETCLRREREGATQQCFYRPESGTVLLKMFEPDELKMGATTQGIMAAFKSQEFVQILEALTGIGPLVSDPYNFGAGLHQTLRGGSLDIHADFARHPIVNNERRVNVFLFVNGGWDESWGGHLELWDRNMSACAARITPLGNRLVVFSSDDFSYHGHPEPLRCPSHRSRRSLAFYYYAASRPDSGIDHRYPRNHSTLFRLPSANAMRCRWAPG